MAPQRRAARTKAAAQQQQQHAANMVLPLLLHHSASIRTQLPLICKLLCCSKWLAAAVAEHCAGQPDLPHFYAVADGEAVWLCKHARLLRSLQTNVYGTGACVAALMAAGPQSLLLQSLAIPATNTTLPLLEQLPASRLTDLNANADGEALSPEDRPALVARVSAALARLTALRSLELRRSSLGAAPGLSGLSALTQLTTLSFKAPLSDLQHASPQLLELELNTHYSGEQSLDLRRLSAVTALDISYVPVKEGDVLPPNLRRLQVSYCRSVQPLLPLAQLQQLQLEFDGEGQPDITAEQLRQLSRLTALDLGSFHGTEPASAGAWPLLPLQRLALGSGITLSAPVCQRLAQLSGLTSLVLRKCRLPQAGSAQQLAAALRQLSGLQQLELSEPRWPAGTTGKIEKATGGGQLLQAMGGLQQLQELRLQDCWFAAANSSSLTALTALKALSLSYCGLKNAAVTAILLQLSGLRSLECTSIADASLPVVGRLQQLTRLSLSGSGMANVGLGQLTGLTQLQEMDLRFTHVTYAGLRRLAGMVGLRVLRMPVACETEQARKERSWLQQRLPDLRVVYY